MIFLIIKVKLSSFELPTSTENPNFYRITNKMVICNKYAINQIQEYKLSQMIIWFEQRSIEICNWNKSVANLLQNLTIIMPL